MNAPIKDGGRVVDESADDRFEQYVRTLIDNAPDVKKLGECLANWLDDDKFNNIEPTLLGIARALAAQGRGEPVAWSRTGTIHDDDGRPIGEDEIEVHWGSEAPDEGWSPLYDAPAASPAGVPDGEVILEHSGCGYGAQCNQLGVKLYPGDKVLMVRGRLGKAMLTAAPLAARQAQS